MKPKSIELNSKTLLKLLVGFFIVINFALFALRSQDSEWWIADSQFYRGVSSNLHIQAILYFIFYLSVYFGILRFFFERAGKRVERKDLSKLFWFVLFLFSIQIYFAIFFGIGVASETGRASSSIEYLLLLFSFDGVYYAYALKEKNKKHLLLASLFYTISNIVRGWAGFIIFLTMIYFFRRGKIEKRKLLVFFVAFVFVMPVLLVVREIFRGGISNLDYLAEGGLSGVDLYLKYFIESLRIILVRFDFYSNYIGVSRMGSQATSGGVCFPIQENIFYKFMVLIRWADSCIALGSILPGSLYSFFADKGTSFSISSGFFALPTEYSILYLLSYVFVLILTSAFVKFLMKFDEYKNFFLVFVFVLLLQGWMYQFLQSMTGFILGYFLSSMQLARKASTI